MDNMVQARWRNTERSTGLSYSVANILGQATQEKRKGGKKGDKIADPEELKLFLFLPFLSLFFSLSSRVYYGWAVPGG